MNVAVWCKIVSTVVKIETTTLSKKMLLYHCNLPIFGEILQIMSLETCLVLRFS